MKTVTKMVVLGPVLGEKATTDPHRFRWWVKIPAWNPSAKFLVLPPDGTRLRPGMDIYVRADLGASISSHLGIEWEPLDLEKGGEEDPTGNLERWETAIKHQKVRGLLLIATELVRTYATGSKLSSDLHDFRDYVHGRRVNFPQRIGDREEDLGQQTYWGPVTFSPENNCCWDNVPLIIEPRREGDGWTCTQCDTTYIINIQEGSAWWEKKA